MIEIFFYYLLQAVKVANLLPRFISVERVTNYSSKVYILNFRFILIFMFIYKNYFPDEKFYVQNIFIAILLSQHPKYGQFLPRL